MKHFTKAFSIIMFIFTILVVTPSTRVQAEDSIDLSQCEITMSSDSFTYNGEVQKPTLSISYRKTTTEDSSTTTENGSTEDSSTTLENGANDASSESSSSQEVPSANAGKTTDSTSDSSNTNATNGSEAGSAEAVTETIVTLTEDVDYSLSYKDASGKATDCKNAGTYTITIEGKGSFSGKLEKSFTIKTVDFSTSTTLITKINDENLTYTGKELCPSVSVALQKDATALPLVEKTDYTMVYANNINAGVATITFTGLGNYSGQKVISFNIAPIDLASCPDISATLSQEEFFYNGKAQKPAVTLYYKNKELTKGVDYKLSYSNNKKAGSATVAINGIGNYAGTLTKAFSIDLKSPALTASMEGKYVKLSWKKVSGASGYVIERRSGKGTYKKIATIKKQKTTSYNDKDVSLSSTYTYRMYAYYKGSNGTKKSEYSNVVTNKVQPAAVKITSVLPLSSSSMEIVWELQDTADGYIIYRKAGNGKLKKLKTLNVTGTNHYTDRKVSYGKTYTYVVKAYWNKNGKKLIGYGSTEETGYTEKLSWISSYEGKYLLYRDSNGDLLTNVEGIIGKQSSYQIKVNKKMNTVTVYAKDSSTGEYTIPVKAFVCSTGSATPTGTYNTPERLRWHLLDHEVHGQWCTRIVDHILFHSVWYHEEDNQTLSTTQYNRLGTTASAGCCRLSCKDAKWIYDNCPYKTQVTIYNSDNPGPLGKPSGITLPAWHRWDPTDPTCQDLCAKHHCHAEYAK